MLVLACAAIGAAAIAAVAKLNPLPAATVTRFAFTLLQEQQLITTARQAVAISPDGTRIAYAADGRLYLRSMSDLEARAIAGTDGGLNPAFAPDGQSLVFWADSTLKRIAVGGSVPVTICTVGLPPSGITWDNEGILFPLPGTGIMRVQSREARTHRRIGAHRRGRLPHHHLGERRSALRVFQFRVACVRAWSDIGRTAESIPVRSSGRRGGPEASAGIVQVPEGVS